jgi:hypothetical protein
VKVFYGKSDGRPDVSCDHPVDTPLQEVLALFHALHPSSGFLGIDLDGRFFLHLGYRKQDGVRVELLDTSVPAFDSCQADHAFAEKLIRAAAEGQDVLQLVRASRYEWEHTDLA